MTKKQERGPLPWFRMYHEIIDDEKIRLIAFEDRWHYVAILACKCKGILDDNADPAMLARKLAVKLGVQLCELDEIKRRLIEVDLIDEQWQPTGWHSRQRISDTTAASRMRAKRERERMGWDQLMEKQGRCCGCCNQPFQTPYSKYVVHDHHHETGVYRALLCQSCNKLVGQLENGHTVFSETKREMCERYVKSWDNEIVSLRNVTA